jgi:hypothetical protein
MNGEGDIQFGAPVHWSAIAYQLPSPMESYKTKQAVEAFRPPGGEAGSYSSVKFTTVPSYNVKVVPVIAVLL